jgi:hypothetical protein
MSRTDNSGQGPAWPPVPLAGPGVQTKPICRHGQRQARAGEVTSGAVARAYCAKQTQFVPHRPEKGAGRQGWKGCRRWNRVVQTRRPRQKSASRISTCVSGPISRISSAGPDFWRARQTKPIRTESQKGQVLHRERVMTDWAAKGVRRNKANFEGPAGGADLSSLARAGSCAGYRSHPVAPPCLQVAVEKTSHSCTIEGRIGCGPQRMTKN